MANSHPTYNQWGKKAGTIQERMKNNKVPKPFTPEAEVWDKEWHQKYGRSWQVFDFYKSSKVRKYSWIEQYKVRERNNNDKWYRFKSVYKLITQMH